jgi:ribonuclease P protein component
MLPQINRLKKKTDFGRVLKKGRGVREGFLLLKFAKNNLKVSRFGFVVGRKISKKATLRNKIKRRLREALRKELPKLKPGFDGVLVALKGSEPKGLKETERMVKKILQKTKLSRK